MRSYHPNIGSAKKSLSSPENANVIDMDETLTGKKYLIFTCTRLINDKIKKKNKPIKNKNNGVQILLLIMDRENRLYIQCRHKLVKNETLL